MGFKLLNKGALTKYLKDQNRRIEQALIYQLEYLIASLINHAKLEGDYQDRTGNLRSSIGGVLLKDRVPVTYKGFEGEQDGGSSGREFINSLIGDQNRGYVILIVAGMEYATYVEDIHNLNVLSRTESLMNVEIQKLIVSLKLKI